MVSLRCASCGKEFEAAQGEATILCPQCRGLVPKDSGSFTDDGTRVLGPGGSTPDLNRTQPPSSATHREPSPSQTAAPKMSGVRTGDFYFLTPPREDGGLGWLAHYRVVQLLGQGGMGMVFQAEDTQLQRLVALKVMNPEMARDNEFRMRFLREARAMAALKSDHIVTVHQVGQDSELAYLAMELLQGESLDDWLERGQRPSMAEVVRIGREIAEGLATAHEKGLIHRDIKPANIFLEGPQRRVKILDFGLARPIQEKTQLTQPGLILGTPEYMAPEQADGEAVDHRCDLFSFGCVLYELATGRKPFTGNSTMALLKAVALKDPKPPREINPAIPEELHELIRQLMAKKPADRPQSAREVADLLAEIAEDPAVVSTATMRLTGGRSATRLKGRNKGVPWMSIVALVGLIAVGSLLGWQYFRTHGGAGTPGSNAGPRTTGPGVSDTEVVLGMSGPFSGIDQDLGEQMELGINTYFQHVNEQGGVAGRKLKLVALDDKYDPEKALANVKELHHRPVFGLIGNVGTPTARLTLPYAVQNQLLFFGAIVNYLTAQRGVKATEVAVFAQDDSFGDDGFRGVVRALRKHGHAEKDIPRVGYKRGTLDVKAAAESIIANKAIKAVVMVATYKPAAKFIQEVRTARPEVVFTDVSFVGSNALADALLEQGPTFAKGIIVTQVVPSPNSGATAVERYRKHLKQYYPSRQPSFVSLEGYIAAAILVEGLKRAGDNLTTDTLIDALESIKDLDLGIGTRITFGPSEHQGSHKVWATELNEKGEFQTLELDQ